MERIACSEEQMVVPAHKNEGMEGDLALLLGQRQNAKGDLVELLGRFQKKAPFEGAGGDFNEGTARGDVSQASHFSFLKRRNTLGSLG